MVRSGRDQDDIARLQGNGRRVGGDEPAAASEDHVETAPGQAGGPHTPRTRLPESSDGFSSDPEAGDRNTGMRDCIVVGAGAAYLSAASHSPGPGEAPWSSTAGQQCNLAAAGIGGLLGHDRRPPAELYAAGRAELMAYPSVELHRGGSPMACGRTTEASL